MRMKKADSSKENKLTYSKVKNNDLKVFDFNHIKIGFDRHNELSINQLGLRCNLCNSELDSDINYCLKCGTKINKNIY